MSAAFIVDCSVAMSWLFSDEATPATSELLERLADESALVPSWWFLEVTNVLVLAERKGRITPNESAEFIADISVFDIEVDSAAVDRVFKQLLPLCRLHRLTSYDAVYLDLALRRQIPLATLDEELRLAASKLGIQLLGR
jgi:predicted nucleic acid-binding protein